MSQTSQSTADDWGPGPNAEFYEFDGEGVAKDDVQSGGDQVRVPGWYHFEVSDVKPELETVSKKGDARAPSILFTLTVLEAAANQSPRGCVHFHRIYVGAKGGGPAEEGSRNSALRWGYSLGLLKEIEREGRKMTIDVATGLTKINLETWGRARGMQTVAQLETEKNEKYGDRLQIPFGRAYQVDDPQVRNVPKNAAALAAIGKSAPAASQSAAPTATAPAATAPAAQPAAQPVAADVAADNFDDL